VGFLIGRFWPTIETREPTRLSILEPTESANPNPVPASNAGPVATIDLAGFPEIRLRQMPSVIVSLLLTLRATVRDRDAMRREILALRHQLRAADLSQVVACCGRQHVGRPIG